MRTHLIFLKLSILFAAFLLGTSSVFAHCPLCTLGAAAAAGGAAYLGVSNIVIGLFIGAFGVSIGWWISRLIKKQFVPFQKILIIVFSFATTILPLMSFLVDVHPLYLSWAGKYGSTFAIDYFLLGSLLGALIVSITPWASNRITALRSGKHFPFQGIILTLSLLLVLGIVIQLMIMIK